MIGPTAPSIAAPAKPDPTLRKAAQQFEAVFVRELIGSMRKASLSDGLFESSATGTYREMADGRIADAIASKGQFGIAAMIETQLGGREVPK